MDSNYFCFDWPNLSDKTNYSSNSHFKQPSLCFELYRGVFHNHPDRRETSEYENHFTPDRSILFRQSTVLLDIASILWHFSSFCRLYLPIRLTTASLMCSFCLFFLSLEGPTLLLLHLTIILFKYFQDYYCLSSYFNQIKNKFTVHFTYKTLVYWYHHNSELALILRHFNKWPNIMSTAW